MTTDLEVNVRTVERDVERLRDLFGAPIEYDRAHRGYRYTKPFELPSVKLREGEGPSPCRAAARTGVPCGRRDPVWRQDVRPQRSDSRRSGPGLRQGRRVLQQDRFGGHLGFHIHYQVISDLYYPYAYNGDTNTLTLTPHEGIDLPKGVMVVVAIKPAVSDAQGNHPAAGIKTGFCTPE